jgi:hypothetical protein
LHQEDDGHAAIAVGVLATTPKSTQKIEATMENEADSASLTQVDRCEAESDSGPVEAIVVHANRLDGSSVRGAARPPAVIP